MEIEEGDMTTVKNRSRRRRSLRNLREGVPDIVQSKPEDGSYGSLWLETDEPVRKRKKRRSSMFVGLPGLHSTPLREESFTDISDQRDETKNKNVFSDEYKQVGEIDEIVNGFANEKKMPPKVAEIGEWVKEEIHLNRDILSNDVLKVAEDGIKEQVSYVASVERDIHGVESQYKMTVETDVDKPDPQAVTSVTSTPNVSLSKASPSSLSPDFPVSPSNMASLFDHSGSFVESEISPQRQELGYMLTKTRKDEIADTHVDLNSSDKENSVVQALDVTPAEVQQQVGDENSPSFLSLCKSIAGKVITFVKTSPSFLTSAIMDGNNTVSSSASPAILQDNIRVLNSGNDNSVSLSPNRLYCNSVPEECNGSYIECKEQLRAKVDKTLDEMEAEITAELAKKTPRQASKIVEGTDTNIIKPVIVSDTVTAGSVKKLEATSTGSARKKRDWKAFFDTFNAVTNELQKDHTDCIDAVSPENNSLKCLTPEHRRSKSSSEESYNFITQFMNESGKSDNSAQDIIKVCNEHGANVNETLETSGNSGRDVEVSSKVEYSSNEGFSASDMPCSQSTSISECIEEKLDTIEETQDESDKGKNTSSEEEKTREKDLDTAVDNCLLHLASKPESPSDNDHLNTKKDLKQAEVYVCNADTAAIVDNECTLDKEDKDSQERHLENQNYCVPSLAGITEAVIDASHDEHESVKVSKNISQGSNVQKRKRKHQVPVKSFTEKTEITEVSDKNTTAAISKKQVKSKSVVSKRKSGQINVLTAKDAESVDKEDDKYKCSASKKIRMDVARDTQTGSVGDCGEESFKGQAATSIEDKISKLTIDTLTEKKKSESQNRKPKRRRSAKLNFVVDNEMVKPDQENKASKTIDSASGKDLENQCMAASENTSADSVFESSNNLLSCEDKCNTRDKKRKRRSANFKDIAVDKIENTETATDVSKLTDVISQVHLDGSSTETPHLNVDQPITVDNLELLEDNVVPRRRKRRSAEAASLKIQFIQNTCTDSPERAASPQTDFVIGTKGSRKRKLESKMSAEELELLYKNKNYVKPDEHKPWQTIFETPGDAGDVYSKKRLQRFIPFEKPSQLKLRRRMQKAVKNGWDARKKKKKELDDDIVEAKLAALTEELGDPTDELAAKLKDILETK